MNRKELKKAFEEGLLSKEEYGAKLVELSEKPVNKKVTRIYEGLSDSDFIKLLQATVKPVHYICFILGAESGLRISEMINLQPDDINLKEHKMFIRQAKGSKDRIVNTPRHLREKHLKYFPIKIKARAISKAFLNASKRAGINKVIYTDDAGRPRYKYHAHCLRHSYALNLFKKGIPANDVQRLMGHANLSTTSRYSQSNPDDAIARLLEKGL